MQPLTLCLPPPILTGSIFNFRIFLKLGAPTCLGPGASCPPPSLGGPGLVINNGCHTLLYTRFGLYSCKFVARCRTYVSHASFRQRDVVILNEEKQQSVLELYSIIFVKANVFPKWLTLLLTLTATLCIIELVSASRITLKRENTH